MTVYEYKHGEGASPISEDCVIALGFFDGVHIAHRDLIVCAEDIARERGIKFGILTFRAEEGLKTGVPRLYGTEEKLDIFNRLGADFTVLANFSSVSSLTPEEFVGEVLIKNLKCTVCVAGFNFRFGKGASGDAAMLERLMESHGGEAVIRDELTCRGATVSSSLIRERIAGGDMETARQLLGSPYFLRGRVSHGKAEGRRLGFPTVNTPLREGRAVPKLGVYRSAVPIGGRIYTAVTNIGKCPTFGEREVHAETYITDFSGDLYEKEIDVYLLGLLREERQFKSAEELKMQINIDKVRAIQENGELTWQDLGLK